MKNEKTNAPAPDQAEGEEKKIVYPVITDFENGDRLVENADGTKLLTKPDGVVIETDASGLEITRQTNGDEEFALKSGKRCYMRAGKGKDAEKAQRFVTNGAAGFDEGAFMRALMCELIRVGDKKLVPEDLEEMPVGDYMRIRGRFMAVNF